jgi:peptide/nickel transport system substrate-binding protein
MEGDNMRKRLSLAVVGVLTVSFALSACQKTTDTGDTGGTKETQTSGISYDPNDNKGPAAPVEGAKAGGTLFYLRNTNFSHLDPQRQYSVSAIAMSQLYARTLTAFKEPGGNKLLLVGDLAKDPGTDVNKDCKTWEFKLRDGVKYEDGSPITAADVAYGISRTFSPDLVGGPAYVQQWLVDKADFYSGWDFKAKGQTEFAPGLTAPDAQTVRFQFAKPHCELPYALALPFSAPVPKAKDLGVAYDDHPFASGPYKITSFVKGTELIMEKNSNWDPNSDPIRHQYPDKIHVKFGIVANVATNRIIADVGDDKNAAIIGVDPALVDKIANDSTLQSRVFGEVTPFVFYLYINCQRVTDLKVRQALNYGIDRDAYIKANGGTKVGGPGTTLLSPVTIGYESYDAYPAGPTGNPTKAKELLGNKETPLVLAYPDDPVSQQTAVAVQAGLEKSGFKITLVSVPADAWFDKIGEKANPWDIYISGWAADWPTAATTIPVLWDGRNIQDVNNTNYSYFNDAAVNTEIDRINAISDPKEAAKAWAALDKKIMTDFAPVVPLTYDRDYLIEGSNVGGLFDSDSIGTISFTNAFLKSGS